MEKLLKYLILIPDFRIARLKLYPLEEILFLVINACICGSYDFEEIVDFGKTRLPYLRKYYPYVNGIPSHDTLNRVLSLLNPITFNQHFMAWVQDVIGDPEVDIISIDGKAQCGTAPKIKNSKKLIHQISAWANEASQVLAQTSVTGKGHEIEGIKALLALLDIQDDIITIDAIGCQTAICEQIVAQEGHYVIAVKANQKELYDEITHAFHQIDIPEQHTHTQSDAEAGRVHVRKCSVLYHLETFIPEAARFEQAKSVICIESERFDKQTRKNTIEKRYYISDLNWNAPYFNQVIRQHWGIENKVHWHLDVTMHEDQDRKRSKNLSTNFALIRKIALNILLKVKNEQKISIKRIQKKALMSEWVLESILFQGD
jgi:predicted transposase YbfD/YdcC